LKAQSNAMQELSKESADHLLEFGKLFKKLLVIQLILLILSLGVGFIPINILEIIGLILLRITSIGVLIFQILLLIQLFHVRKTYLNVNITLSVIFFLSLVASSIVINILEIILRFIESNPISLADRILSTAALLFEILFWIFFRQFLIGTEIYLLEKLLNQIKILIIIVIVALAINIFYYFGSLGGIFDTIMLLVVLIIGVVRFFYQLTIANGLIENFTWNN
jgi:hypothetical protein